MAKLQAYELQDFGLDTIEANHALGFRCDCRDFRLPAAILRELGVRRVRLLSNNPRKASALRENGIEVAAQLACEAAPNPHSFAYLRTKKEKMGHALRSWQCEGTRQTEHLASRRSHQPKPNRPPATSTVRAATPLNGQRLIAGAVMPIPVQRREPMSMTIFPTFITFPRRSGSRPLSREITKARPCRARLAWAKANRDPSRPDLLRSPRLAP
jgi:GTP cyclohydrolase II